MKRIRLLIVVLSLTICMVSGGIKEVFSQKQEKFDLSFTASYMDRHPTVLNGFVPWMKALEERSGGRLKLRYFNPGTLCPEREIPESIESGTIDIGGFYTGLSPGKFPLNELIGLPFLLPGAEAGSLIVWDLYQQFPSWQAEFRKIKVLWQWTSASYQLHTTKKLIRALEDLKGMKIIVWSPTLMDIVAKLGGISLMIPGSETYLGLERGMADGVLSPLAPVRSFKISDTAKYTTIIDCGVGAFCAGMNLDSWNRLPADLQKLLIETTGAKMSKICGVTLDTGAREDAKLLKQQGNKFYVLPSEEKKRWVKAVQAIHDEWLRKMEGLGYKNIKEIYDTALKLSDKYEKITGRGYEE